MLVGVCRHNIIVCFYTSLCKKILTLTLIGYRESVHNLTIHELFQVSILVKCTLRGKQKELHQKKSRRNDLA